ncbi:hypothetical protein HNQ59_001463 [Chitinivorax tropicus]|uniref:Transmembrane protein n=1 Tax=Chitinivorax tropicus TaxID=714531 RepID=A0A840MHQ3_9PROT|nr:hypothetical protein [Chitinivorax tropicus]MBB5018178.1 hypothetical protein [Chitinivorax tropicus]
MNAATFRAHWFYFIAPFILLADGHLWLTTLGAIERLGEAALLLDLTVLIPCLYWLCYRQQGRQAVIRAAALACLGIWAVTQLIPEADRTLLNYIAPLRYLGLAALIGVELIVVMAIYRRIFKGGSVEQAIAQVPDIPPGLARWLALEAAFWLKVWGMLKRAARKSLKDNHDTGRRDDIQ